MDGLLVKWTIFEKYLVILDWGVNFKWIWVYYFVGNNPFLWLFPVKTAIGDGLSYPSRTQGDIPSYQDAGRQSMIEDKLFMVWYLLLETCAAVPSVYIHEGPSRTLINPTVGGQLSVTLTSNQPPVTSETSASMVRLENNGYTKTVMLDHSDLTQLSVHR